MDTYDRNARLYPAMAVAAPATLFALTLFALPNWWSGLVGFALAGGLHVLVVQVVRDLGSGQQPSLYEKWGGAPTTVRLRWAEATNSILHRRRHGNVSSSTGIDLPDAQTEAADPAAADEAYEAATAVLKELTRNGADHPLVQAEVTQYGFRRNLYGCRPYGIAVAALAALGELSLALVSFRDDVIVSTPLMFVAFGFSTVWVVGWLRLVTPDFVRLGGDRYAEALIGAAATLPGTSDA